MGDYSEVLYSSKNYMTLIISFSRNVPEVIKIDVLSGGFLIKNNYRRGIRLLVTHSIIIQKYQRSQFKKDNMQ